MKVKLLAAVLVVSFFLAAFTVQLTRTHASQPPIAIIGGVMNANATSHITILSVPGSRSGMVIFYRCNTGITIRTVYPNQNANSLGRYTWQWSTGAPCSGVAIAVTNSRVNNTFITAQKIFVINAYQFVSIAGDSGFPSSSYGKIFVYTLPGSIVQLKIIYTCNNSLLSKQVLTAQRYAYPQGYYVWNISTSCDASGGKARVLVFGWWGNYDFVAQKIFIVNSTTVPNPITPTPVPPSPTPAPIPTTPITGVNGNPWGYDFDSSGNLIFSPPGDFCGQYFSCVSSFWTSANGYVAECANGVYTHSGGVRGACSRDGGVLQALYSH